MTLLFYQENQCVHRCSTVHLYKFRFNKKNFLLNGLIILVFQFDLLKTKVFVLSAFSVNLFCFSNCAVLFKATWCWECTIFVWVHVRITVSSTYSTDFVFSWLESTSLVKIMKSCGSRIDPWGTPKRTSLTFDLHVFSGFIPVPMIQIRN